MRRRAAALLVATATLALAAAAHARPALELHARRGVGGLAPAGGIDVVEVEVASAADVPLSVEVTIDGGAQRLVLAARGRSVVTVARRVPAGATSLGAVSVRARVVGATAARGSDAAAAARGSDAAAFTDAIEASVASLPVVARPVVVVTDDAAAVLPGIDRWRRTLDLGAPVAIAVDAVPPRWQSLIGVGALVIDRPVDAFAPEVARRITWHLAGGGQVCRLDPGAPAPRCTRAAPLALPRTARAGSIAPATRALGSIALVVALALALAAAVARRRGSIALVMVAAALALGAAAPSLGAANDALAITGIRATAGNGEDWIAAELGANELTDQLALGGDLWIEPSGPAARAPRLDTHGLAGRIPGPGSWRVRGFVPAAARDWTRALVRIDRAVPEAP